MSGRAIVGGLGLMALTLVLALGVVEAVFRVYSVASSTGLAAALAVDPYQVQIEPHGEAGYRPRPDRVFAYENGTAAHINGMGFRGPAVAIPKPRDVFRVVLLGGSTTFGWGVNDTETIDAHMRELLRQRYPSRHIEVVNLGFDGYDSYQLLERFRVDGVRFEPDVVIVNSGVNDVRNAWYSDIVDGDPRTMLYLGTLRTLRREEARGRRSLWTRAKHYLYVARAPGWVRSQLPGIEQGTDAPARHDEAFYYDALDYFQRNLERLLEEALAMNAAVVFSTPPSSLKTRYQPTDESPRSYWLADAQSTQEYRDSLGARARMMVSSGQLEGLPVAYVAHGDLDPALFLDDAHLTSEGNGVVAENFTAALEPFLSGN